MYKRQSEYRELAPFDRVSVAGSRVDVVVRAGDGTHGVTLVGDENLLDHVETTVEDGVLIVAWDEGSHRPRKGMTATVTAPELRGVELYGSADVVVTGLDAASCELRLAGSGDLKAAGRADVLTVHLSGDGDLSLKGLSARQVEVRIDGQGDVDLGTVDESLSVRINGSGDLSYAGYPQVSTSIYGSGDVDRR